MEERDRPTTADIAAEEREQEERDRGDGQGLDETLRDEVRRGPEGEGDEERERSPLLEEKATSDVQQRWERIQVGFVDEPRRAVEEADALVAELMQQLARSFAQERERLEGQWARGDEVSTEDLRVALQRYRSFFDRLLAA